ncbi:MAG: hypothetical protein ABWY78_06235 [Microvirga sp.]
MPQTVKGNEHRRRFQDISGSTVLAVGDNLSATLRVLAAGKAGYTIYVQSIAVHVLTDNAATLNFQDDATTPVVVAKTKASPGIGPIYFEFGDEGRALTEGKDFELGNSAAGLVADITWQGYKRLSGVITPANLATAG